MGEVRNQPRWQRD